MKHGDEKEESEKKHDDDCRCHSCNRKDISKATAAWKATFPGSKKRHEISDRKPIEGHEICRAGYGKLFSEVDHIAEQYHGSNELYEKQGATWNRPNHKVPAGPGLLSAYISDPAGNTTCCGCNRGCCDGGCDCCCCGKGACSTPGISFFGLPFPLDKFTRPQIAAGFICCPCTTTLNSVRAACLLPCTIWEAAGRFGILSAIKDGVSSCGDACCDCNSANCKACCADASFIMCFPVVACLETTFLPLSSFKAAWNNIHPAFGIVSGTASTITLGTLSTVILISLTPLELPIAAPIGVAIPPTLMAAKHFLWDSPNNYCAIKGNWCAGGIPILYPHGINALPPLPPPRGVRHARKASEKLKTFAATITANPNTTTNLNTATTIPNTTHITAIASPSENKIEITSAATTTLQNAIGPITARITTNQNAAPQNAGPISSLISPRTSARRNRPNNLSVHSIPEVLIVDSTAAAHLLHPTLAEILPSARRATGINAVIKSGGLTFRNTQPPTMIPTTATIDPISPATLTNNFVTAAGTHRQNDYKVPTPSARITLSSMPTAVKNITIKTDIDDVAAMDPKDIEDDDDDIVPSPTHAATATTAATLPSLTFPQTSRTPAAVERGSLAQLAANPTYATATAALAIATARSASATTISPIHRRAFSGGVNATLPPTTTPRATGQSFFFATPARPNNQPSTAAATNNAAATATGIIANALPVVNQTAATQVPSAIQMTRQ